MAASMIKKQQVLSLVNRGLIYTQICHASKETGKAGSKSKGRNKPRHDGIKLQDGSFVHKGQVLVRQIGLRYYPGENVYTGSNYTLQAMVDGQVIISHEKLNPHKDSPIYELVQKGLVIHKKFINVYPAPLHGKYRLVDEV